MGRRGLVASLLVGGLVTLDASSAIAQRDRPNPVGSDPFVAGEPYRGDFPDPTIWRVGPRYYAASTTVAALSLPVISSTDLRTWTTAQTSNGRPYDALPTPPRWADINTTSSNRKWVASWAPDVARIVNRRTRASTWVAAYAVPRADGRRCISFARARHPLGPYVDASAAPLACGTRGVIDPQIFVDGSRFHLLFKIEGSPDRLWVRRLNNSMSGFAPGTRAWPLLKPRLPWEGAVVENPAMIRFKKKLYLFYSGNGYGSSKYATGYAICKKVTGPCRRASRLLFTGRYLAGPGGATPFVDRLGRLRLIYHAWKTGNVGYPDTEACLTSSAGCAQRRMYIATLIRTKKGRLGVYRYF